MTLLVSLASYILSVLTFAHFSHFTHIYNNETSTLYHFAWEFKKPFIISFITLHFIQLKINELFAKICRDCSFKLFLTTQNLFYLWVWLVAVECRSKQLLLVLNYFPLHTERPKYKCFGDMYGELVHWPERFVLLCFYRDLVKLILKWLRRKKEVSKICYTLHVCLTKRGVLPKRLKNNDGVMCTLIAVLSCSVLCKQKW